MNKTYEILVRLYDNKGIVIEVLGPDEFMLLTDAQLQGLKLLHPTCVRITMDIVL